MKDSPPPAMSVLEVALVVLLFAAAMVVMAGGAWVPPTKRALSGGEVVFPAGTRVAVRLDQVEFVGP